MICDLFLMYMYYVRCSPGGVCTHVYSIHYMGCMIFNFTNLFLMYWVLLPCMSPLSGPLRLMIASSAVTHICDVICLSGRLTSYYIVSLLPMLLQYVCLLLLQCVCAYCHMPNGILVFWEFLLSLLPDLRPSSWKNVRQDLLGILWQSWALFSWDLIWCR